MAAKQASVLEVEDGTKVRRDCANIIPPAFRDMDFLKGHIVSSLARYDLVERRGAN